MINGLRRRAVRRGFLRMKRGREFREPEERGRKTPAPKVPGPHGGLGNLPQDVSVAMY